MRLAWVLVLAACSKKTMEIPNLVHDAGAAKAADAAAADAAPAAVAALTEDKVVIAEGISCSLMSDATVRCDRVDQKLRGVKDLVASRAFACALLDDSSVTCWGDIGFGKEAKTPKPAGVSGVTKAVKIFAVAGAGCAAIADGELACWGDVDERGRIGAGGAHRAPTAVRGVDHIAAVAERAMLREDGDLSYWDGNAWKRAGISDGKEVASSGEIACVLRADKNVYCMAPQPICTKPPAPKKLPKGKKPPPPEPPKRELEKLPLGAVQHLAFIGDKICARVDAKQLVCIDRACKITRR